MNSATTTAQEYADHLIEKHGSIAAATSYAYNYAYGVHDGDGPRPELGAQQGDEKVLRAREAFELLQKQADRAREIAEVGQRREEAVERGIPGVVAVNQAGRDAIRSEIIERSDEIAPSIEGVAQAVADPTPAINTSGLSPEIPGIGRLRKSVQRNGDVSYSLPLNSPRALAGAVAGWVVAADREAFRECNRYGRAYIEITGTSEQQVLAAMAVAKHRWGNDDVVLHVEGRHRDKIIAHAVRAGLNIANTDPATQALVAKERERQANPLTRNRSSENPMLERVPASVAQARSR